MTSYYLKLILSVIFIGSVDSFGDFRPLRAQRTVSNQYHCQARRRWICTLSSHSIGNSEEEDTWVKDPTTGRRIKRNGPKCNQILHEQGGYILHDTQLAPIELERLWAWTQNDSAPPKKTTISMDDLSVHGADPGDKVDKACWRCVEPEILSSGEATDDIDMVSLPYLDELLFVCKSSSLLTLPGIGEDKQVCLASLVNGWLQMEGNLNVVAKNPLYEDEKKKKRRKAAAKKPFVPRPCHRLDYDTSGVMVIGLTRDSLGLTSAMFEQKEIQSVSPSINLKKTYIALVAGKVLKGNGVIDYPIGKIFNEAKGYNEFVCMDGNSQWKKDDFVEKSLRDAKTRYTVLKRFKLPVGNTDRNVVHYTRVKLEPLTGRGHQLRLHMAAIGHPILGDELHAPSDVASATPRLCLHAEELELGVRIYKAYAGHETSCMARVRARFASPF